MYKILQTFNGILYTTIEKPNNGTTFGHKFSRDLFSATLPSLDVRISNCLHKPIAHQTTCKHLPIPGVNFCPRVLFSSSSFSGLEVWLIFKIMTSWRIFLKSICTHFKEIVIYGVSHIVLINDLRCGSGLKCLGQVNLGPYSLRFGNPRLLETFWFSKCFRCSCQE